MNHVLSVTFIPASGLNVVLDKELFLSDFIAKSEEYLDSKPVGSSIEIIYDHVKTDMNMQFIKVVSMECVIKQTKRGIFHKTVHTIAPVHIKNTQSTWGRYRRLKNQFLKSRS